MAEVLSLDNPVFASFAFYGALVMGKMLLMAGLTAVKRTTTGATPNPEDVQMMKTYSSASAEVKKKLGPKVDEGVERVRRVHLNDLENIPAFFCVGLLYVLIRPDPWWAAWHFRAFFVARVSHTVAYLLAIPQPSRGIAFIAGMVTTMSLVVQVVMAAL